MVLWYFRTPTTKIKVGDNLPDIPAFDRPDIKGKVLLINFWATWCPPCVAEMPSLQRLHQQLNGSDFLLLAVNEDGGDKARQAVEHFRQRIPFDFEVIFDTSGEMADLFGASSLPTTFLIDKEGKIREIFFGAETWDNPEYVAKIRNLQ